MAKARAVPPLELAEWLPLSLFGLFAQTLWLYSCKSALVSLVEALCSSELVTKAYPAMCRIDTAYLTGLFSQYRVLLSILWGQLLFELALWLPWRSRDEKVVIVGAGVVLSFGVPFNLLTNFMFFFEGILMWCPVAVFLTVVIMGIYGKQVFPMGHRQVSAMIAHSKKEDTSTRLQALTATQYYEVALLQIFSNIALAVTITLSIGIAAGMSDVLGAPAGFSAVRLYGPVFIVFLVASAYFFVLQSGAAARVTEGIRTLVSASDGPKEGELPTPSRSLFKK